MDLEKIRGAAERVAGAEGLEVVDVEWKVGKQRLLRVYIDRAQTPALAGFPSPAGEGPAGVSHADCERVSKQLSVILDVEELVPGPGYVLEVSSPGLDRALKKLTDFERFTGRLAKVWTEEPVEDRKFFEGRLSGVTEGRVRLQLKGKASRVIELPFALIRKANLVVEF